MPSKPTKKVSFKETLILKIDEYMDAAFATNDPDTRQKYGEAIRQIEKLLITITEIE